MRRRQRHPRRPRDGKTYLPPPIPLLPRRGGEKTHSPFPLPLFPLALGHGNDGKPFRFNTFPHPARHPPTPPRLSPSPRENKLLIFPWPKGHRGAYIINIFYSLFYDTLTSCYPLYPHRGGIYYQYILFPIFTVIIACPGGSCQAP